MITELNAGDEIQVVNPSGQSSDSAQFIKIQQRLIASGQGLSYEATSRDMSESNYSSARQGIIEDEETYGEEIEQLNNAMDEIYETFVISCVLSGAVIIPDFGAKTNILNTNGSNRPRNGLTHSRKQTQIKLHFLRCKNLCRAMR